MKASLRIAVLALSVAGLSACASSQEKSTYVSPGVVGSYAVDSGYVSNIERLARKQGALITWVNAPVVRPQNDRQQ